MAVYKRGMSGSVVLEIKKKLFALGYLSVSPTHNKFGSDTDKAVRKFQMEHGLEIDGVVDSMTLAALRTYDADNTSVPSTETIIADLKARRKMMLTIIKKRVGDMYVWGAQGHLPTDKYIDARAVSRPKNVSAARASRFKQYAKDHPLKANGEPLRCEDCSGLFWAAENIVELPLDATGKDIDDSTASGLYHTYCVPVKKTELQPLDLCFSGTPKITHVGIIGLNGKIYEAAGSEIGVVENDNIDVRTLKSIYGPTYGCNEYYSKSKWSKFGRLKIFANYGI